MPPPQRGTANESSLTWTSKICANQHWRQLVVFVQLVAAILSGLASRVPRVMVALCYKAVFTAAELN